MTVVPSSRLALVSMPWVRPHLPSIQLGVLKPLAEAAGYRVDTHHFYLRFCQYVAPGTVQKVSDFCGLGDWLFALVLDPSRRSESHYDALRELVVPAAAELCGDWASTRALVDACGRFIDDLATSVPWSDYDVVGFSTTFDQNLASLCLARRIKEIHPEVRIVFGGANVDGTQGPALQEAFPFIDVCVLGEAETSFPKLLDSLRVGHPLDQVPGLSFRRGDEVVVTGPAPLTSDMDAVPVPDYDAYFDDFERFGLDREVSPVLAVETSRGCWFGKCLFCGLNRETIRFRRKSPERALREIETLVHRHRTLSVYMVDNILDRGYVETLLPQLTERRRQGDLDVSLFYELKANHKRDEFGAMARAGVDVVQLGVESFSTSTLKLMRKGSTAFHNIQALKWCQEFGIQPTYNLIWGFPGQTPSDLAQEVDVIDSIQHLQPPASLPRVDLQRFSPYFSDPQAFGFRNVHPNPFYSLVYPENVDLARVVYSFAYDLPREPEEAERFEQYTSELMTRVSRWRREYAPGQLVYWCGPGFVKISDQRRSSEPRTIVLTGWIADFYRECEEAQPVRQLAERFSERGTPVDTAGIQQLVDERLVFLEGGRALALAVRQSRPPLGRG
ncbi:MAG TPA: RiPP maturation radical SAM C-methyltransferase [Longimicrobiaceae bacterium]|nr:RiPP maturation radical SAM C-methyltransferase [Longimicrobiaceae bacterium]